MDKHGDWKLRERNVPALTLLKKTELLPQDNLPCKMECHFCADACFEVKTHMAVSLRSVADEPVVLLRMRCGERRDKTKKGTPATPPSYLFTRDVFVGDSCVNKNLQKTLHAK